MRASGRPRHPHIGVLLVCDITYAYNESSGGIRTYLDAKRRYIAERTDWTHVLIVPGEKDSETRDGRLVKFAVKAPMIPGSRPYRLILNKKKVRRLLEASAPDIMELGSIYVLPWVAYQYQKATGCPVVGFYHTDFADAYVQPFARRLFGERVGSWAKARAERYVKRVYGRCDVTFTASALFQKKLGRLGIDRTELVPLGVDLETFHPRHRSTAFRTSLKLESNDPLLVYCGRFDSEKRVDMIVEAYEALPSDLRASMLFIGQGPLEEDLKKRAEQNDRLFVLPYTNSREELATYLASADMYVAGNPHETFGLSVVEAQASGLPVVGVRSGALIDRVTPDIGALCEPDDALSMSESIAGVLRSDTVDMARGARRHVEQRFSWTPTFDRMTEVYSDVVSRRRDR